MKGKFFSKKLVYWILFFVFLWILIAYFGKTKEIVEVLRSGRWYWVGSAVLVQLFYYPYYSYFIEKIYDLCGIQYSRKQILPVYIASKFTDVALPISTFGEVAIFIRNAKKHGISPVNAGIGIGLKMLFEIGGFLTISTVILGIMYLLHQQRNYLSVVFALLFAAVLLAALLIIRIVGGGAISRLLLWPIRLTSKIVGQGSTTVNEIKEIMSVVAADLRAGKAKIWPCFRLSLIAHFINMGTFAIICLAFTGHINILAILAGYVAGILFTIVSITPQGVGVAEAMMIATMHSFGVEISAATVITLAFRGLLYWLPIFPGFYAFSRLELKEEKNDGIVS